MPSDSKKKKEQQKKEARKKKPKQQQQNQQQQDENDSGSDNENSESQLVENGEAAATNGIENSENGPSEEHHHGEFGKIVTNSAQNKHIDTVDEITKKLAAADLLDRQNADNRACTGVLASHPHGRDVHIDQFSLTFYGQEILVDAKLELNMGRRYGILGLNGCGKSTVLSAISRREIPIPK
jgi:ATP-binding cassette subfamily F protein 2